MGGPFDSADRGRLKIYFGYAAGVGRTSAMLLAAGQQAAAGTQVLLAGRALSGRAERDRLAMGLAVVSPRNGDDLPLDEVLRRKPDLLLLPHLARRNALGGRHPRRHQDVVELLAAGIDVWTTLEVRHIESLVDLVEQITGSPVEEAVPDAVFDAADEVEVVDLPPENLLERLPEAVMPSKATLIALREVALRRAADRLNKRELTGQESGRPRGGPWQTVERLVVCVGPSPTSARLIRTASRMAGSMHAQWIAVHVDPPGHVSEVHEHRLIRHLRLAESLGAQTDRILGRDVAQELVAYARSRNATKIIIGKTGRSLWGARLRRPLVDQVIATSGDIDVYVIRGMDESLAAKDAPAPARRLELRGYLGAAGALAAATAVATGLDALGLTDASLVLTYLLWVTATAAWYGHGPAVFASFAAVLLFNFFFTTPHYTFEVHDSEYFFTFGVMLVIGLLVSTLTARIRDQSVAARQREQRTEQLYRLSQELSATTGSLQIATAAEARLSGLLDGEASILLPDELGRLQPAGPASARLARDRAVLPVATWVHEHGRNAGAGTDTHADAPALCLPLTTPEGVAGVLVVRTRDPDLLFLPDRRRLIETFAAQVALALQRDRLTEKVHRSIAQAENERLRSAVLSSVSHDFRTPLAAITGASSSLLDTGERIEAEERRGLLQSIHDEADRLARLVDNLLHMTRLEAGQLEPRKEWNVIEDLVGSALTRLSGPLGTRTVTTAIPDDLPLVRVDGVLVELVLTNLLDNAAKYSPPGTSIDLSARTDQHQVLLEVADRGPGLAPEEKDRAFEKFYRGSQRRRDGSRGAGLGLAICAAITRLHGGSLGVEDRDGGGARFVLALPVEAQPPAIDGTVVMDGAGGEEA